MMPFDGEVFGPRTIFFSIGGEGESGGVVFQDDREAESVQTASGAGAKWRRQRWDFEQRSQFF
jgi:hypothetical protein